VNRSRCRLFGQSAEYSARAVHLIRDSLVIDMLDQFLYRKDRQPTLRAWLTKAGAFTEADLFHESSGGDGRAGAGVLGARGGSSQTPPPRPSVCRRRRSRNRPKSVAGCVKRLRQKRKGRFDVPAGVLGERGGS
jgi:hypothetical protein